MGEQDIVLSADTNSIEDLPDLDLSPNVSSAMPSQSLSTKLASETNDFTKAMDKAQLNVLEDAGRHDNEFIDSVKARTKEAAIAHVEAEKENAELRKQVVQFKRELVDTQQQLNEHKQAEDKWANKQKGREYHYNGVKPLMESISVKSPMNVVVLYVLVLVVFIPFLVGKLFRVTFGNLIAGASDGDRPKAARRFMWTLLAILTLVAVIAVIYIGYQWIVVNKVFNLIGV